jgi:hypothetical protein
VKTGNLPDCHTREPFTPGVSAGNTKEDELASPLYTQLQVEGSRMFRNVITAVCFLLAVSFISVAQSKNDPGSLAGALKGDNKGSAATNKQCKLFTMAEAGSYVGGTIHNMDNAAAGTGCQWTVGANNGSMLVQVVPARDHEKPSHAPGYKKMPDIGPEAFVVPEMGGWHAGSLQGTHAVHVMLSGKGASEARTIDLLKESMKREAAAGEK